MREQLEQELEKIGLAEKEAKVYLAALELGPSTAQSIAAKATVNRPTTYIMIESLIKRGLMSSFEKGKKRFFQSAPPHQLLYLIETQKKELSNKEKIVQEIISKIGKLSSTKVVVSVLEGIHGIPSLQEDILVSGADTLYELVSVDDVRKFIPPVFNGDQRQKIIKKMKIKSLYSNQAGPLPDEGINVESRYLSDKNFPISGEILIYGNSVALGSFNNEQPTYIIVRDENISRSLITLFSALWLLSKK